MTFSVRSNMVNIEFLNVRDNSIAFNFILAANRSSPVYTITVRPPSPLASSCLIDAVR